MKTISLCFVVVFSLIFSFFILRSNKSTVQTHNTEPHQNRYLAVAQPLPSDPKVCCSILKDLSISIEIQPQWTQKQEFCLMVNVEKPLGKTYFVNPVEQSYILFVNDQPWKVSEIRKPNVAEQISLEVGVGSLHRLLRFTPEIPDGAELVVEWVNRNLRTGQMERLRSAPLVYNRI